MSLRLPRLVIILAILLVSTTLYLLYPTSHTPRAPGDAYSGYEAGGIDSPHFRDPVVPNFKDEAKARMAASIEECDDEECAPPGQAVVKAPPLSGKERLAKGIQDGLGWFGGGHKQDDSLAETVPPQVGQAAIHQDVLHGNVIMPKLDNATAKAELGRAAWRVLHLMTLRYPETPTPTEREALKSYFHLFARMYPCGECAEEFQKLLKEYPPQTGSRKSASLWLCHVHNQVNLRLGKPEFDCLTLDETYDCGCGDEKVGEEKDKKKSDKTFPPPQKGEIGGKLLGGQKGSGKEQGKDWKDAPPRADPLPLPVQEHVHSLGEVEAEMEREALVDAAAAAAGEEHAGQGEGDGKGNGVVVDEAARQKEMIDMANEELGPGPGDDF